jgi:S1-C subfamily serine protease
MMSQGCTTSPPKTANPYMQARATTVLVNNLKGSIGTGNVVNDKCVLTAAHVADQDIVDLVTASDKEFIAMRVAHDEAEDIAVVCATVTLDAPAVSIGPDPATYDPVFTIGYPKGRHLFLTTGQWEDDDTISADCAPGNSGGGVFDMTDHYVGFVDAVAITLVNKSPNLIYHICDIVGTKAITKFLDTNHIQYQGHI